MDNQVKLLQSSKCPTRNITNNKKKDIIMFIVLHCKNEYALSNQ